MRVFDLFGGIGGFSLAAHQLGHTTIGYADIDKHATAVYTHQFPQVPRWTDAKQIKGQELPDFDLLCAGFPCQPFSTAGKRKGTHDERGTLFSDIIRLAQAKKPAHLLLENVPGLLSAQGGYAYWRIRRELDALGYFVEGDVLNGLHFQTAQDRERIYLVAHDPSLCECPAQVFPLRTHEKIPGSAPRPRRGQPLASALEGEDKWDGEAAILTTLTAHHTRSTNTFLIYDGFNDNIRQDEGLPTISTVNTASVSNRTGFAILELKSGLARRLTPVETERAFGFPDDWTLYGDYPGKYGTVESVKSISDSVRARLLGNSIIVPAARAVLQKIRSA